MTTRIVQHPILGDAPPRRPITLYVDGRPVPAFEGEMVAAALWAAGKRVLRYSPVRHEPRGIFCAIGRCTDCVMTVNGQANVRTCITPAEDGMINETQGRQSDD